jgi:hypothetical protein
MNRGGKKHEPDVKQANSWVNKASRINKARHLHVKVDNGWKFPLCSVRLALCIHVHFPLQRQPLQLIKISTSERKEGVQCGRARAGNRMCCEHVYMYLTSTHIRHPLCDELGLDI